MYSAIFLWGGMALVFSLNGCSEESTNLPLKKAIKYTIGEKLLV
jgi:hypothetical protein